MIIHSEALRLVFCRPSTGARPVESRAVLIDIGLQTKSNDIEVAQSEDRSVIYHPRPPPQPLRECGTNPPPQQVVVLRKISNNTVLETNSSHQENNLISNYQSLNMDYLHRFKETCLEYGSLSLFCIKYLGT